MDLKFGFLIILYYGMLSLFILTSGTALTSQPGFDYNIELNDSSLSDSETDTGGVFSSGLSFSRWFLLVGFGVGLPDDTASGFKIFYFVWTIIINLLVIMWIINSIWSG